MVGGVRDWDRPRRSPSPRFRRSRSPPAHRRYVQCPVCPELPAEWAEWDGYICSNSQRHSQCNNAENTFKPNLYIPTYDCVVGLIGSQREPR